MTIEEFLYGSFYVPIDKQMAAVAILNRGITAAVEASTVPLRIREILVADIMTTIAKTSYGFRKHSNYGEWSVDINGDKISGSDMRSFIRQAQKVYVKWEVINSIESSQSSINV